MIHASTAECAWGFAPVFVALGLVIQRPNAMNRFTYSNREVLFAT
ncbi:hypothetical protein SAMN05216344_10788 [Polaromonas sp. OV174]|nr:hypothetical protein SAMN05216344_10788 [Polaromonas sp. OV174]